MPLDAVLSLLFGLSILISIGFLILRIGYYIMYELEDPVHPAVMWANELYEATNTLEKWMEEGKLKRQGRGLVSTHLVKLTGRNRDKAVRTLRLITGPNGWAVYQMLLVQRKSWRRFLFRK